MVTKGVDSVPSAVRNLTHFSSSITHESFVDAVSEEFRKVYGGGGAGEVRLFPLIAG